jgi:hypothetical protein
MSSVLIVARMLAIIRMHLMRGNGNRVAEFGVEIHMSSFSSV